MTDWLKNRLSPIKSETQRWLELADANESFWESLSDPDIVFLKSLRSIFSASPEGRVLLLREMGGFFEDNLPEENLPVALVWRRYELLKKETTVPLENMMKRLGTEAKWEPCWALSSDIYGSAFYIKSELPQTYRLDGSWTVNSPAPKKLWPMQIMTSRAVLAIDLNAVRSYSGHDLVRQRALAIRPAHIVFDGFRYLGKGETTLIADLQPKLDGTWQVKTPTGIVIKSFPLSHDYMMGKAADAKIVFGPSAGSLSTSTLKKPVRVADYGTYIDFIGVAQKADFVGSSIGAAGLLIDGVIQAPFSFLKKTKTADDSYKITITLRFR